MFFVILKTQRGARNPRSIIINLVSLTIFLALTLLLSCSPLHDAAEAGDVEQLTKLLTKEEKDGDFNPVSEG